MRASEIRRLRLATFIRPGSETESGAPRVESLYVYLISHEHGWLLMDTGLGEGDPEADAWYRPTRVPLTDALAAHGVTPSDITHIANCHLHFDHIGGNPQLAGRPIFAQRTEYETAMAGDYTNTALVDFPGARYELLNGAAEILPGVQLVPTPGHTAGHQSVVLTCDEGTVILAGQTHDTASGWAHDAGSGASHRRRAGRANGAAADALATEALAARSADDVAPPPSWMPALLALNPIRVAFAHDAATWP